MREMMATDSFDDWRDDDHERADGLVEHVKPTAQELVMRVVKAASRGNRDMMTLNRIAISYDLDSRAVVKSVSDIATQTLARVRRLAES
jgi:hypothetical protein